jgi:hypothetical protein
MDNLAYINCHLTLPDMKDARLIPFHFALPLLHDIKTKGALVNHLQSTGNPAPGKVTAGCFAAPVFCKPPGDMMTGRARYISRIGPDLPKMYDPQTAILIQQGGHFQFRFKGSDFFILIEEMLQTIVIGFLSRTVQQLNTFRAQCVFQGFLQIDIIVMAVHGDGLSGDHNPVPVPVEFILPVKNGHFSRFYNFMSDRILGNAFAVGQRIIPTGAVSRQILINTDNVNQQADFH